MKFSATRSDTQAAPAAATSGDGSRDGSNSTSMSVGGNCAGDASVVVVVCVCGGGNSGVCMADTKRAGVQQTAANLKGDSALKPLCSPQLRATWSACPCNRRHPHRGVRRRKHQETSLAGARAVWVPPHWSQQHHRHKMCWVCQRASVQWCQTAQPQSFCRGRTTWEALHLALAVVAACVTLAGQPRHRCDDEYWWWAEVVEVVEGTAQVARIDAQHLPLSPPCLSESCLDLRISSQ
jgi:hypothetical protein